MLGAFTLVSVMLSAVVLTLAITIHRIQDHESRINREVAVLLCSHHWQTDGRVTHETPAAFRECVLTYNLTGRVP